MLVFSLLISTFLRLISWYHIFVRIFPKRSIRSKVISVVFYQFGITHADCLLSLPCWNSINFLGTRFSQLASDFALKMSYTVISPYPLQQKTSRPSTSDAAIAPHIITLPPPCFADGIGSRGVFGFLHLFIIHFKSCKCWMQTFCLHYFYVYRQ